MPPPLNVQSNSAQNAGSVAVVDYAVPAGSNRVLVAIGSLFNGSSATLSCAFGASSMTQEITRIDDRGDGQQHRVSIFRLLAPSGTETVTLTSSDGTTEGLSLIVFTLPDTAQQAAEVTASAADTSKPFTVSIGPGVTENGTVIYGLGSSTSNENITALTESGCTELAEEETALSGEAFSGAGWEAAGASGSEAGGFTHDGTGSLHATLVAAAFAPAAGADRSVSGAPGAGAAAASGALAVKVQAAGAVQAAAASAAGILGTLETVEAAGAVQAATATAAGALAVKVAMSGAVQADAASVDSVADAGQPALPRLPNATFTTEIEKTGAAVPKLAFFWEGDFASGFVRFWTGYRPISFLGETWNPSGKVVQFTSIEETLEVKAPALGLIINGLPKSVVSLVETEVYAGRESRLLLAVMSAAFEVAAAITIHRGDMDVLETDESRQTATVRLTVEGPFIAMFRRDHLHNTPAAHKARHPGDSFFDHQAELVGQDIHLT